MSEVPAWVVGMIGTAFGGLIYHGFSIISENRKWRREDRHRFLDDRVRNYTSFLRWTHEAYQKSRSDIDRSKKAAGEASACFYGIEIVCGEEVHEAARVLMNSTLAFHRPDPDFEILEREFKKAREDFRKVARNDLEKFQK